MAKTAPLSRIAKSVFGDVKEVPRIVHEGRKALHTGEGTHSLFLWPLQAALRKLKGKGKIDSLLYEKYHRKLINADERLGRTLAQHGPSEKMFSLREKVPTTRKIKGLPASVEHETFAASAPVKKIMGVAGPLAAGMYLSEKLGSEGAAMAKNEAKALMKQAADTIERYERREEAIKIAMEMVEREKCEPFRNYDQFVEKVASLEAKNLEAVREALEMHGELTDFGKVASPKTEVPPGSDGATMKFFHRLSE